MKTETLIRRLVGQKATINPIEDWTRSEAVWKDESGQLLARPRIDVSVQDYAADLAAALHELGHVDLNPRSTREAWPDWLVEARASGQAIEMFDNDVLWRVKGADRASRRREVIDTLKTKLARYLQAAADRGVDVGEMRRAVSPELWTEPARSPTDEEIRSFLAGPRF